MATFTSKGGFIPEYRITVGLEYQSFEHKSEDDLINYDWEIEDFKYIDVNGVTIYGEDKNVRRFKDIYDELDYYGTNIASRLLMKEKDYCMVLSEDMPLYQKIKEKFIITLDFSKLLDKLEDALKRTKDHQKWGEEHISYNYGMLYLTDISFYKSFCDFIKKANDCRITKKDKNFKFIKQEELDSLDVDKLLYSFDKCKYNMFNYDNLYIFFKWYVDNRAIR